MVVLVTLLEAAAGGDMLDIFLGLLRLELGLGVVSAETWLEVGMVSKGCVI